MRVHARIADLIAGPVPAKPAFHIGWAALSVPPACAAQPQPPTARRSTADHAADSRLKPTSQQTGPCRAACLHLHFASADHIRHIRQTNMLISSSLN